MQKSIEIKIKIDPYFCFISINRTQNKSEAQVKFLYQYFSALALFRFHQLEKLQFIHLHCTFNTNLSLF